MPIPSRRKKEKPNDFMSRCMSDDKLRKEFPDNKQRTAVCMSKACESLDYMEAADFNISYDTHGFEEEINVDNFVIPSDDDYVVDIGEGEEELEWDVAVSAYLYENPKTGELSTYNRKGVYKKGGVFLIYKGKAASEYQDKKVKLNKPFRTPDGPKKFSVYAENENGSVVKVNFGDYETADGAISKIKKNNPKRKTNFRARHKCDTDPGPKCKARYWICKMWE